MSDRAASGHVRVILFPSEWFQRLACHKTALWELASLAHGEQGPPLHHGTPKNVQEVEQQNSEREGGADSERWPTGFSILACQYRYPAEHSASVCDGSATWGNGDVG